MSAEPDKARRVYLGYRGDDGDTPWGKWFTPEMAPLADHVVQALAAGVVTPPLIGDLASAPTLLDDGDQQTENGYTLRSDGSMAVAIRTPMPRVTPAMWDWWFGWHGCDARRYKLWHPRAHLYAQWADGPDGDRRGRDRYVGRTSFVDEYIGAPLLKASIRFVRPSELGFDESLLDADVQTTICARVGSSAYPADVGWLVHHVRRTESGAEMRSRFWLGGPYVSARSSNPALRAAIPVAAKRMNPMTERSARELLVHCAQEMAHLASFLPELHAELGDT